MTNYVAVEELAGLVKAKRGKKGLRETAREIGGISPSTLSRVEQGKMPDLDTFLLLCDWLEVAPNRFFKTTDENEAVTGNMSTPEIIEAQLRSDKELSQETAEAIAQMVKAAYTAVKRESSGIIEAHLRADRELEPETAEAVVYMLRAAHNAVITGRLGKKRQA